MKHFVAHTDKRTLFFIDEFGTGTDPNFGGAMAEVILEELLDSQALGMVTTHYSNLKNLSASKDGLVNAAMLFEKEKLKPLYQLELGIPGSSFTFEVATIIGLSPKIIKEAKRRLGKREKQAEELLVELENTKAQIRLSKDTLNKKEKQLDLLLSEYTVLKEEILNRKKQIINEAKSEAKEILGLANKKIETTIKTIVESKANKKEVIKARVSIKKQVDLLVEERITQSNFKKPAKLEIGMEVFLVSNSDTKGHVIEINKKEAQVVFGIIKGWFKNKDLLVRR
jgi:DNA mismatch repair protein MutS2